MSSSLKMLAYELDNDPSKPPFSGRNFLHKRYPSRVVNEIQPREGFTTVGIIRDPVERFCSLYKDKIVKEGTKARAQLMAAGLPPHPSADALVSNLTAYAEASKTLRHHLLPQVSFLGRDLDVFDQIFTTRQVSELESFLSAKTKSTCRLPQRNRSVEFHVELSDKSLMTLRSETYCEDYVAFRGYI